MYYKIKKKEVFYSPAFHLIKCGDRTRRRSRVAVSVLVMKRRSDCAASDN